MSKIEVNQSIKIYEVDDKEVKIGDDKKLKVLSHWTLNTFVRLRFGNETITVCATDLKHAVDNATNTG